MRETGERSARSEISLDHLRASDLGIGGESHKHRVLREIERIITEYGEQDIVLRIGHMNDMLHCSKRRFCMNAINNKMEAACLAYLQDDQSMSLECLQELDRDIREAADACEDTSCRDYALSLVSEVIAVFEISIEMEKRICSILTEPESVSPLDPDDISKTIAPLSHPIRVAILLKLERGRSSFSEISKELELRTGHLQFHLRTLEEAGYVRQERRGGEYLISVQGMSALSGLRTFMANLVKMDGSRNGRSGDLGTVGA